MSIRNIAVLLLLVAFFGCKKDKITRQYPVIEVAINDSNKLTISDSIFFIAPDTLPNQITVVSEIADADLFYSVNNSEYAKSQVEPVTFQKQDTVIDFYLSKAGYENSKLKTIIIRRHSKKYLEQAEMSDPVLGSGQAESDFSLKLNDKSRGILTVEVYTMSGQRRLQRSHHKKQDQFTIAYVLADFPQGLYIASVTYGKDKKTFKLLKQ